MFSKKPTVQPAAGGSRAMASGSTFSIFGADTVIKGDVTASADLHVDGRIDGDIACAALVQGETGQITGAVRADSARLAGKLKGSIIASELVILRTARIEGDVFYDALTIEQGAQVDGRFAPRTPGEDDTASGEAHLILASSNPAV